MEISPLPNWKQATPPRSTRRSWISPLWSWSCWDICSRTGSPSTDCAATVTRSASSNSARWEWTRRRRRGRSWTSLSMLRRRRVRWWWPSTPRTGWWIRQADCYSTRQMIFTANTQRTTTCPSSSLSSHATFCRTTRFGRRSSSM